MTHDDPSPTSASAPLTSGAEPQPVLEITADMIASNISAERRVAPKRADLGIIDDIYSFADRLRAGSTLRTKPGG